MMQIDFAGQQTSRIGFGCGRLVAGVGLGASIRLVETALDLGIRYFDTAPSYGMGTSEDALGHALAGSRDATIVTKVGLPRPTASGLKVLARQALKPAMRWLPGIKARVTGTVTQPVHGQFESEAMRLSLEDSLRRLRQESVAGVLLHEAHAGALTPAVVKVTQDWIDQGLTRTVGSGSASVAADLCQFGDVSQYRWTEGKDAPSARWRIAHGLLRHYPRPPVLSGVQEDALRRLGRDPADPAAWVGAVLTMALASDPGAIILLSSNQIGRLRAAVNSIDWHEVECGITKKTDLFCTL